MHIRLIILFTVLCTKLTAQTGSWSIVNVKMDLNEKWNLFGEAQIRSLKFYDDFHYYELKGGATYKFSKSFSASAGVGMFDTYSPGGNFKSPMANDETRTWVQLSITQYEKGLKFEHRYRAEQRWTSNGFRNRFRYRLNAILPLKKKKVEPKTFYLNASNEIFYTDRAPYFERNRLFLGGGYEFSEGFSMQGGWMKQFDYRINDETGRSFFQIAFLFDIQRKNKTSEKVPGAMD
ncbi:MAG: DUF2490 domain-containing protein [Bacteroidota bacterium]|nr:DUF2490 domain-containing protein [Bacteroidota bacterium]